MGLDMYAYSISAAGATFNNTRAEVLHASEAAVEIAYWRKFNNLHGWMERLYRKKGGDREFNCVNVPLTKDDLATLEKDVAARNLPPEAGFSSAGRTNLRTKMPRTFGCSSQKRSRTWSKGASCTTQAGGEVPR